MYYPDLAPCTYWGPAASFLAVGWLDGQHPYARGPVPRLLVERLAFLIDNHWEPRSHMGWHDCEICPDGMTPHQYRTGIQVAGRHLRLGVANLFIPSSCYAYAAPSLILHYILAHGYRPPTAFLDAVYDCPDMFSEDYHATIMAYGPYTFRDTTLWPFPGFDVSERESDNWPPRFGRLSLAMSRIRAHLLWPFQRR
jgi:hypothetical protein